MCNSVSIVPIVLKIALGSLIFEFLILHFKLISYAQTRLNPRS
jgi:hypothetical protein